MQNLLESGGKAAESQIFYYFRSVWCLNLSRVAAHTLEASVFLLIKAISL